ncbi:MAG: TolC family protein, partial [Massilia sp.]
MRPHPLFRLVPGALAATLLLGGCAVGPAYHRPDTPAPQAFKEAGPWLPAAPADALERGPWWTLFGDPQLNQMADSIEVSNQNVAAAVAAYAQARAAVQEQRASLFPTVSLSASADRNGGAGGNGAGSAYRLNIGSSWEPDLW